MKTYAAYYDDKVRIYSSSGGLFSLMASYFDVTYGVAMSQDCYECRFVRIEDDIKALRGSKYFQAKMGDTLKKVKQDLDLGKRVLFSGTACQIEGVLAFLGKKYSNLFLLDIVCHGVPSAKLWKIYAQFQEKKIGKLKTVSFRDKKEGWVDFCMRENNHFISMHVDSFMQMFLRNYCLRPSCYECRVKCRKSSDITIGDFWGIQEIVPEMDDNKGVSLVIVRTDEGEKLFEQMKKRLVYTEVSYEDGVRNNFAEYRSVDKPILRNEFYNDLDKLSFDDMEKKYASSKIVPLWEKFRLKVIKYLRMEK